jgi:hypothetical protein
MSLVALRVKLQVAVVAVVKLLQVYNNLHYNNDQVALHVKLQVPVVAVVKFQVCDVLKRIYISKITIRLSGIIPAIYPH